MAERLTIEIVHGFTEHKPGDLVKVPANADGQPASQYWRRRLRDAERDGCVKLVSEKKKSKESAIADGGNE